MSQVSCLLFARYFISQNAELFFLLYSRVQKPYLIRSRTHNVCMCVCVCACMRVCVQLGAVKLVLLRHWMHLNVMLPVMSENQFYCTRLYVCVCHNERKCQTNGKHDKRYRWYFKLVAACKENYNKSKRPVSSVNRCHPLYRRKKRTLCVCEREKDEFER